jgi:hypothetical protein
MTSRNMKEDEKGKRLIRPMKWHCLNDVLAPIARQDLA